MRGSIRKQVDRDRDLVEKFLSNVHYLNEERRIRRGDHFFDFILEHSRRIGVAVYIKTLCESGRLKIIPSGNLNYILK